MMTAALVCWLSLQAGMPGLPGFAVHGTVDAASGVEVALLDDNGFPVARAQLGAGGRFEIRVAEPGHYRLALRRDQGYRILERVHVTSSEPVVSVTAARVLPGEAAAAHLDPAVSAARLRGGIPGKAHAWFRQAVERKGRGEEARAMELLEKAVALAPDYLEALNDLAVLYLHRRDYVRAEAALRRAVELDPNSWQPRMNLGVVLLEQQSFRWALPELNQAWRLAPASPLPAFQLGRLHLLEGQGEAAERWLTRALDLEPRFPAARLLRGYARLLIGRLAEARSDLAAYLNQAPPGAGLDDVRQRLRQIDQTLGKGLPPPDQRPK